MLIYKEELPLDTTEIRTVELPFNSVEEAKNAILKIDSQYGLPVMWYQVDYNEDYEKIKNTFTIIGIGTGHNWKNNLNRSEYIGTCMLFDGSLVLHYFLLDDAPTMLKHLGF